MLAALQDLLTSLPSHKTLLDDLLPKLCVTFEDEFLHWVDGGAGVGTSTTSYSGIMDAYLPERLRTSATIHCYEPLPENAAVLRTTFAGRPRFVVREAALADAAGSHSFNVPSRLSGVGTGPWAPGTSYAGSLKHAAAGVEQVDVHTVRLADEAIPSLDFVKLDLQGGELDAIHGIGERLPELKLLYVEAQLLHDWGLLRHIAARRFLITFDRLQFGFRNSLRFLPTAALDAAGIVVDRMHFPDPSGMPLICWGHFRGTAPVLDPDSFVLKPQVAKDLIEAGLSYLQTDALCFNLHHWNRFAPLLLPR